MNKILSLFLLILVVFLQKEVKGQYDMRGKLVLTGVVVNTNSKVLKSNMYVVLKNDTVMQLMNKDSIKFTLNKESHYEVIFSKRGYKSKMILVDTRNTGENEFGYEMPLKITLEKGDNSATKLMPVGSVFYDPETDLYETSPYYVPIEKE